MAVHRFTAPWNLTGLLDLWEQILEERHNQDTKFGWLESPTSGMANGSDDRRMSILVEEVGEVAHAINEHDDANLEEELIQVAAVAVAWLQARREKPDFVANLKRDFDDVGVLR